MSSKKLPLVLVTGATGFIATQVIQDLYESGLYRVRGTTRNYESEKSKIIRNLFPKIELVACTLTSDAGWEEAFRGVTFVLHLASPYLSFSGGNIEDFVKPAKEGTRRVLEGAMKEPLIKRVVITSSIAAIAYGHDDLSAEKELGPKQWTNLENPAVTPYQRSKTVAEKFVWEFKETMKPSFDICTINPGMVVGPLLSEIAYRATSSKQVKQLLKGGSPVLPRIRIPVVDVRDVSMAHVRALESNRVVDGKRYILVATVVWMINVSRVLCEEFASLGYKAATWELWYPFAWLGSFFTSALADLLPGYGIEWTMDGSLAERELLDGHYRSWEKAMCSHAKSLLEIEEKKKSAKN